MKRQMALGALAAGTLAACGTPGSGTHRPTLLLVHGAWHGAWCWKRVMPVLKADGWRPLALTLPGLAERRTELSTAINLESHISAVVEVAARVDGPVALLGHSYGGFVITGAADRLAPSGRLASITYLDAFVPRAGQRASDSMAPGARAALESAFARGEAAYAAPPVRFFGIENPEDAAWVQTEITAQPAGTYLQPLRLNAALPASVKRSYIACQRPRLPVFDDTKARIRDDPAWTYGELQTGHDAMITAPRELASMIGSLT